MKKNKEKEKKMVKCRNNIVLVRHDSPKKVTFNGRSFNVHFRRVNKNYLPGSTKIARTYKGRQIKIKRKKKSSRHIMQQLKDYQNGW